MCARAGVRSYDVPADGNCLFSAVALSAALTDGRPDQSRARAVRTAAERLRSSALDVICTPQGVPDPDLTLGELPITLLIEPRSGEDGTGYCRWFSCPRIPLGWSSDLLSLASRRMRRQGEWGSTAELLALTQVLGRQIRVHTPFGVETYGADQNTFPLAVKYEDPHYQAITEEPESRVKVEVDGSATNTNTGGTAWPNEARDTSTKEGIVAAARKVFDALTGKGPTLDREL